MKLLAFGEVLWDVYPDKKFIGGATLNFAAHFAKQGGDAYFCSAVGKDALGKDALEEIRNFGIKDDYIQILDDKLTGQCLVTLDGRGVPSYNLLSDVAYDNIKNPLKNGDSFDLLYFGTLSFRGEHNARELSSLIETACFKKRFVDINVRLPHTTERSILFAFNNADIIKISDEELPFVLNVCAIKYDGDPKHAAVRLCEKYKNIELLIITMGANGSFAYSAIEKTLYECPVKKATVVSTVGAGDSFSATFMTEYLKGKTIPECLERASEISAFVVSKKEAVPEYTF